jgi:hypothetical protein
MIVPGGTDADSTRAGRSGQVVSESSAIQIRALYRGLLERWNRRDADAYAASFAADGNLVGFHGSPVNGREEFRAQAQLGFMFLMFI